MKSSAALRRFFACVVFALVFEVALTGSLACLAEDVDWSDLIRQATPAVVYIQVQVDGGTASGSGAIISPDGYILTAAHVIEGASSITVIVEEESQCAASVSQVDYDMDVAVLKISATNLTWLALGDVKALIPDEEIRLLGYPRQSLGFGMIIGRGVYLGHRATSDVELLQIEISPFDHGHSGGPIINANGEIVGVAVGTSVAAESLFPELGEEGPYVLYEHQLAVSVDSATEIIPSGYLPDTASPVQPGAGQAARVIQVPHDYVNLTAAIAAVPEGGEIQVEPGVYQEDATISKPMRVTGEAGVVISGAVSVTGTHDVFLRQMEIRGGLELLDVTAFTLGTLVISGSPADGLVVDGGSGIVADCSIESCAKAGVTACFGAQLYLYDTVIRGNGEGGLALSYGSQAWVSGNIVESNEGSGIEIRSSTAVISGNQITQNNGFGISADIGSTVTGEGNVGWANTLGAADTIDESVCPALRVPQAYATLEDALQVVPEQSQGTLILLAEGNHTGGVTIAAGLTLRGEGAESSVVEGVLNVRLAGSEQLSALPVVIQGITVGGIFVYDSSHVAIRYCTIERDAGTGILAEDSSRLSILNCSVSTGGIGIWGRDGSQVSVTDCGITESQVGIGATDSAHVTVVGCTVSGNGSTPYAGHMWQPSDAVPGSEHAYTGGISAADHSIVILNENIISDNAGWGVGSSSSVRIEGAGNVMEGNSVDLRGNVSGSLRVPLTPATQQEITWPDARYATLQHAVDALLPGGRLVLDEGEYEAGLTIAKEISLVAAEGARVSLYRSDEDSVTLSLVGGARADIEGLMMSGGGHGCRLGPLAEATIANCIVEGTTYAGISLEGSCSAMITACEVYENQRTGISVREGACVEISDCAIHGNATGIHLSSLAEATISNCTILENGGSGLYSSSSSSRNVFSITDSLLSGNRVGIDMGSDVAIIRGCAISGNVEMGISAFGSEASIEACTISDNGGSGMFARWASGVTVLDTEISRNTRGIEVEGIDVWGLAADTGSLTVLRSEITENAYSGIKLLASGLNITESSVTDNGGDGIYTSNSQLSVTCCIVSGNAESGIALHNGSGPVSLSGCTLFDNGESGLQFGNVSSLDLTGNMFFANSGKDIELYRYGYRGHIAGAGNSIERLQAELSFLTTEEGGDWSSGGQ